MCLRTPTWPLTLSPWVSLGGAGVALSSWGTWSELKRGLHHLLLCRPPAGPGLGLNSYWLAFSEPRGTAGGGGDVGQC